MSALSFEGLVLAGGESRRMGTDKALLKSDGATWLERRVHLLHEVGCRRVRIATRAGMPHQVVDCEMLFDRSPNVGPLEPIAHGLATMLESHLVILAVDLTAMTSPWLSMLMDRCAMGHGCVPRTGHGWETLAAVYPREVQSLANAHLLAGNFAVKSFVQACVQADLVLPWHLSAEEITQVRNANQAA